MWSRFTPGDSELFSGFEKSPFNRLDPHLVWAALTYLRGGQESKTPIPVMFEANVHGGVVQLPSAATLVEGTAFLFSPFFTGFVQLKDLLSFSRQVARFRIGVVARPRTLEQRCCPKPVLHVPLHDRRDEVVVGVIDHGIAFANSGFALRGRSGQWHSRIERIWDQQWGYPSPPGPFPKELYNSPKKHLYKTNFWKSVPSYGYGRQLTNRPAKSRIDFWMNQGFSESEIYRHLGYLPAQHDRAHGTHVLGVAAGRRSYEMGCGTGMLEKVGDPASRASIIAVQLPALPYKDTSGTGLCVQILDAVSYIAYHAGGRKFVINLSDGAYAGPHDGNSLLERALDGFFAAGHKRRAFVVAAGNQFDERVHWKSEVPAGNKTAELTWRILPDDNSDSHLEIWPAEGSAPSDLKIRVTPPGQPSTPFVSIGQTWALHDGTGQAVQALAAVHFSHDPPNGAPSVGAGPRAMVHIAVGATRPERGSHGTTAPHGVWKVQLQNKGGTPIAFDAYIERDNPALGDAGPRRQSHFTHPDYPRSSTQMTAALDDSGNTSPIKRMGSLNNVAAAQSVLVVGGHVFKTGQLSAYSAAGPGRSIAGNVGVDVLAVADSSQMIRGIRGYGVKSGTSFRMDGTSVAAPQVTRWVTNWMASGSPSKRADWEAVLGAYVSTQNPVLRGPRDRAGFGRLPPW